VSRFVRPHDSLAGNRFGQVKGQTNPNQPAVGGADLPVAKCLSDQIERVVGRTATAPRLMIFGDGPVRQMGVTRRGRAFDLLL
jgi:hypothetical protein